MTIEPPPDPDQPAEGGRTRPPRSWPGEYQPIPEVPPETLRTELRRFLNLDRRVRLREAGAREELNEYIAILRNSPDGTPLAQIREFVQNPNYQLILTNEQRHWVAWGDNNAKIEATDRAITEAVQDSDYFHNISSAGTPDLATTEELANYALYALHFLSIRDPKHTHRRSSDAVLGDGHVLPSVIGAGNIRFHALDHLTESGILSVIAPERGHGHET